MVSVVSSKMRMVNVELKSPEGHYTTPISSHGVDVYTTTQATHFFTLLFLLAPVRVPDYNLQIRPSTVLGVDYVW